MEENQFSPKLSFADEGMKEFLARMSQIFHEANQIAYSNGWYLNAKINARDCLELTSRYHSGGRRSLDEYFVLLMDKNAKTSIAELKSNRLDYSEVISEAYQCHCKKLYFASTILFLSTADGISKSILFSSGSNLSRLKAHLKEMYPYESGLKFVSFLLETSPLRKHFSPDGNVQSEELNRHGVMHGLDNQYGNKKNSLKALSLLLFISDFWDRHKRNGWIVS